MSKVDMEKSILILRAGSPVPEAQSIAVQDAVKRAASDPQTAISILDLVLRNPADGNILDMAVKAIDQLDHEEAAGIFLRAREHENPKIAAMAFFGLAGLSAREGNNSLMREYLEIAEEKIKNIGDAEKRINEERDKIQFRYELTVAYGILKEMNDTLFPIYASDVNKFLEKVEKLSKMGLPEKASEKDKERYNKLQAAAEDLKLVLHGKADLRDTVKKALGQNKLEKKKNFQPH